MSFGVDALGALIEKLKQLNNDTQDHYEAFIDYTQLYKKGKMNEKDFFTKIGDYLVASSALNLLAVRVILELKNSLDKGTPLKSPTGGVATNTSSQSNFGIGGFVNTGGQLGGSKTESYDLPMPQEDNLIPPTLRPVEMKIKRQESSSLTETRRCKDCNASLPQKAKFCNKCGRSQ